MKYSRSAFGSLSLILVLLFATSGCGKSIKVKQNRGVTISWETNTLADGTTIDSSVTGYRVYYGTSSRNYPNSISVGKVMSSTISGLTKGTKYYIAIKAEDTSGNLSGYSAEVTKTP